MTPFEKIESFKSKCVSSFGERLECLVLTGSYARGDYTPQSDIDLWVLIKNLSLKDIQKVGKIVSEIPKPPEINPQCTSIAEMGNDAFKDEFNPIQLYVDGIVIHGSLPGPVPSFSAVMSYASSIAAFALMSARHYLAVKETEESLSRGKLLKWVIRPVCMGITIQGLM
jgi:predicted nucleotidyltransferase